MFKIRLLVGCIQTGLDKHDLILSLVESGALPAVGQGVRATFESNRGLGSGAVRILLGGAIQSKADIVWLM